MAPSACCLNWGRPLCLAPSSAWRLDSVAFSAMRSCCQRYAPPAAPCACSPGAAAHPGFAHLLSLHALVVTDVELCMPAKDPAKFVRVLSPYLKPPAGDCRDRAQRH